MIRKLEWSEKPSYDIQLSTIMKSAFPGQPEASWSRNCTTILQFGAHIDMDQRCNTGEVACCRYLCHRCEFPAVCEQAEEEIEQHG